MAARSFGHVSGIFEGKRNRIQGDQDPLNVAQISVMELLIYAEAIFRLGGLGPSREERRHLQSLVVDLVLAELGPSFGDFESRQQYGLFHGDLPPWNG
jgi:hypothetical protein